MEADQTSHRWHLRKLEIAEIRVARGRELIVRQRELASWLSNAGSWTTSNANTLLNALEDTQKLFEGNVDLLKWKLASESPEPVSTPLAGFNEMR